MCVQKQGGQLPTPFVFISVSRFVLRNISFRVWFCVSFSIWFSLFQGQSSSDQAETRELFVHAMRDKHRTRSASRLPSALLAWAVLLLCFLCACSCLGAVPPQHGPLCPFHATSFDDDSDLYFQPQPVRASLLV